MSDTIPLHEEHEALKRIVTMEINRRAFWRDTLDNLEMKRLVDGLNDEVDGLKERLTAPDLKADETARLRSQIGAYRDLLMRLDAKASDENVNTARRNLAKFEQDNALFLDLEPGPKKVGDEDEDKAAEA